jgi:Fe-S cluster assembly scaffold protein SufB
MNYIQNCTRKFLELDLPSFKYGLSTYIPANLKNFEESGLGQIKSSDHHRATSAKILEQFYTTSFDREDKLAYHNASAVGTTLVYDVTENTSQPIVITSVGPQILRVFILVRKGCTANIIIDHTSTNSGYYGEVVRVISEENSQVKLVHTSSGKTTCIKDHQSKQELGSQVDFFEFTSSVYGFVDIYQQLGTRSKGTATVLTKSSGQSNISTRSLHKGINSLALYYTKSLVSGSGKALSQGEITMEPGCTGSSASENHHSLLLDTSAEAHALPTLYIGEHDITGCSHSASIQPLDQEQLFYLQSKGLSEHCSKQLMIDAFSQEVLDKVPKWAVETVQRWYHD